MLFDNYVHYNTNTPPPPKKKSKMYVSPVYTKPLEAFCGRLDGLTLQKHVEEVINFRSLVVHDPSSVRVQSFTINYHRL